MTKKYQLKNGMNVLLVESHKSPVVSIQMWVKTGSADETKGLEGISHFIEHLVFKGSEKFAVGEIASAVEGAGGVLNAYTTFDQTVFYVTLSSEFTDTGLEVISQMMGQPKFDENEINNEREVVLEEIKRGEDSPQQQASRHLFSNQYERHPYGIPVIGYDKNIRRVSRASLLKYYHGRYVPQNMNLVVVGNFKSKEMQKKIESYFGAFKKYKLLKVKRAAEPQKTKPKINFKSTQFEENFIYFSWPTPGARHKDILALSVFASAIGQGESSRLYKNIRNEKHLVNSISAGLFSPSGPGFFAISGATTKDRVVEATQAIQEELTNIFKNGIEERDLERAIKSIESEKYFSMETVDGLAGLYGYYEFIYNDPLYFEKFVKSLEKIDAASVLKVAKKYLTPQKMNISVMSNAEPKVVTQTLKSIADTYARSWGEAPAGKRQKIKLKTTRRHGLKMKIAKNEGRVTSEKIILPTGATLLVRPIKTSPLVSARVGVLGGLRYEPADLLGVNELTTRVWPTTTKSRSEAEINHEIEMMSSGFGAFGGRNSLGLSMTVLAPHMEKTWEILADVLTEPIFNDEIIKREKKLMQNAVRARNDKPAQKCMLLLTSQMFKDHPYARDPLGNEGSIERLNGSVIEQYLFPLLNPKNLVISFVGNVNVSRLETQINSALSKLGGQGRGALNLNLKPITENLRAFEESKKEQTHMAYAFRGLKITDEERFTLEVMQSILSGQGGRLFVELRDKASLAYTVSPIRMDGIEGGYFGAYIGCSPDKVDKAFQMMRVEFDKLTNEKVGAAELERAKRYLLGRHDIALQRTGHVADLMLFDQLYGLAFNEFEKFKIHLESVTPEKVRALAGKIFSQNFCLSVVGQKDVSI